MFPVAIRRNPTADWGDWGNGDRVFRLGPTRFCNASLTATTASRPALVARRAVARDNLSRALTPATLLD